MIAGCTKDGGIALVKIELADESATLALGAALAPLIAPGTVIWLEGDLGAGKTALVRACLRGLGYAGPVKSPTYALVEVYVLSSLYWYHFDFYRFNEPSEFDDAGLGEYFRNDAVCLVEWPDKAAGQVPPADLEIRFQLGQRASERVLELRAPSAAGQACLTALASRWPGAGN